MPRKSNTFGKSAGSKSAPKKSAPKSASKKQAASKQAPPIKIQKSYTFRDLPIKGRKTLQGYLTEAERNSDKIEKLRRPGEMWIAEIRNFADGKYYATRQPFQSFKELANYISKYESLMKEGSAKSPYSQETIESIRFARFGSPKPNKKENTANQEYQIVRALQKRKDNETSYREKIVKERVSKAREVLPMEQTKGKRLNVGAIADRALDALIEANKTIARIEKELAALKRERKAASKKRAKKAAPKKAAPKKAAPKKAAPKNAAPKNAAPKKAAPKKAAPKKATVKKSAPKKAVPKQKSKKTSKRK